MKIYRHIRKASWHQLDACVYSPANNYISVTPGAERIAVDYWSPMTPYTMRCRYDAVNSLQYPHNRHHIARPWGRVMGCILWLLTLIYALLESPLCCVQNHIILDRFITAIDCNLLDIDSGYSLPPVLSFTRTYPDKLSIGPTVRNTKLNKIFLNENIA